MDTEARRQALENKLRRHKIISLAISVVVIASPVYWALRPAPKTVVAEKFVLRDGKGKIRSFWAVSPNGTYLVMSDESGSRDIALTAGKDLGLYVDDKRNKKWVAVGFVEKAFGFRAGGEIKNDKGESVEKGNIEMVIYDSGPSVGLWDSNGKLRGQWDIRPEGPSFRLTEPSQKRSVGLQIANKAAGLYVNDKSGKARFFSGVVRSESLGINAPQVQIKDEKGRPRGMFYYQEGVPELLLFDAAGKDRASIHLKKNGDPSILLLDENEKPILSLPDNEK